MRYHFGTLLEPRKEIMIPVIADNAQALFDNFWNTFGANYELIGSSRSAIAELYSVVLSSKIS